MQLVYFCSFNVAYCYCTVNVIWFWQVVNGLNNMTRFTIAKENNFWRFIGSIVFRHNGRFVSIRGWSIGNCRHCARLIPVVQHPVLTNIAILFHIDWCGV
uniref:Uncharacterized protein n=1 Tax=Cacopsylla melanoneura TaxID=428564 RepID=A0A8D8QP06_9HEMI